MWEVILTASIPAAAKYVPNGINEEPVTIEESGVPLSKGELQC